MFSKPLAFGLLALGCLTAAAGGAYVATRHNAADATAPPAAALARSAAVQPAAVPQGQPVAETEAAVASAPAKSDPPAAVADEKPAANVTVTAPEARVTAKRAERARSEAPRARDRAVHSAPWPEAAPPVAPAPTQAQPAAIASVEQPRQPEPQPEAPRVPQFEEVVVPTASVIGLQVQTPLSSERARVEDRVEARVTRDVHAGDHLAIPAGSRVLGSVTLVERGGKLKERARLGIRFHTLVLADGTEVPLHTEAIIREGEPPSGDSAKKIGGAAVGGAILGAILGGGKGAAIGGAVGAGGGTAAVMAGDRNPATLPSGAIVTARLSAPVTIQVEKREEQ